jgi:hypothetical protein
MTPTIEARSIAQVGALSEEGATLQSMALEQLMDQMRALEIQLNVRIPPFFALVVLHFASPEALGFRNGWNRNVFWGERRERGCDVRACV